jgi:hypothetical protein
MILHFTDPTLQVRRDHKIGGISLTFLSSFAWVILIAKPDGNV